MNIIYIYNKKNLNLVAKPFISNIEEFKIEPAKFYPLWDDDMVFSHIELKNPVLDNETLREKTREELLAEGKEVQLKSGEFIEGKKIKIIKADVNLIKPVWNSEKHEWWEGYSREEYFKDVDTVKANILADGYTWGGHRQKCRDKDIGLMTATIESLRDYQDVYKQEMEITWYFEDNDGVKVKLKDMQELRLTGLNFVQKVYKAENILKIGQIQKVTKEMYLELLNI